MSFRFKGRQQQAGFSAICNQLSEHLPQGCQVNINIEHGGYGVNLITPNGECLSPDNDNLLSCIEDAVEWANEQTKGNINSNE